jgi:imidazolonepropionase-like amidohydrolase
MSPHAAIQAATGAAARRLGVTDVGSIAAGAIADLVVLYHDPEKDIQALRTLRTVYVGGVELRRETLLESNPGSWRPTFSFPAPNASQDSR